MNDDGRVVLIAKIKRGRSHSLFKYRTWLLGKTTRVRLHCCVGSKFGRILFLTPRCYATPFAQSPIEVQWMETHFSEDKLLMQDEEKGFPF